MPSELVSWQVPAQVPALQVATAPHTEAGAFLTQPELVESLSPQPQTVFGTPAANCETVTGIVPQMVVATRLKHG